jgi:hypothetical protein
MEPYPSGQFGFIDDPYSQFGNGSVWTWTWTRSDGPEPLLTLGRLLFEQPGRDTNKLGGALCTPLDSISLQPVTILGDEIH